MMNDEQLLSETPKIKNCQHERHDKAMAEAADPQLMPLCYFQGIMKKIEAIKVSDRIVKDFSVGINRQYLNRLEEIEVQASHNLMLKAVTYQEWVDCLLHMHEALLTTITNLQSKIELQIAEEQFSSARQQILSQFNPQDNDLKKLSNDMARLKAVVRNKYLNNTWNWQLGFETFDPKEIIDVNTPEQLDRNTGGSQDDLEQKKEHTIRFCSHVQSDRVHVHALVREVADKHDEIRELKKQINSLEEEIQNAQKKIQLKDDVIKELRADLKNNGIKSLNIKNNDNDQTNMSNTDEVHVDLETLDNHLDLQKNCLENSSKYNDAIGTSLKEALLEKNKACENLQKICYQLTEIEKLDENVDVGQVGDYLADSPHHMDQLIMSICNRFKIANGKRLAMEKRVNELIIELNDIKHKYDTERKCSSRYKQILDEITDFLQSSTENFFDTIHACDPNSKDNPWLQSLNLYSKHNEKIKFYKAESTQTCNNSEPPPIPPPPPPSLLQKQPRVTSL